MIVSIKGKKVSIKKELIEAFALAIGEEQKEALKYLRQWINPDSINSNFVQKVMLETIKYRLKRENDPKKGLKLLEHVQKKENAI